jgi:hypothetical protein
LIEKKDDCMRKLANLFFALYLADGVVSFLHELSAIFLQTAPTSSLRNLIAVAALLLALPLYVSLGIDRRLPKAVIIPQVLFVSWMALGAWPVVSTAGSFGLLSATIQVLLGILPFILYAGTAGRNRLLPEERFLPDFFGLRNTVLFFSVHIILLPLAVGYMTISILAQYADQGTAGFMRLGSDGLHMEERVYTLSGKKIRLTGMIHIGEHDFYQSLIDSIGTDRTVILAEGVTDQDNLLTNHFGYGEMAQTLGLTSQSEMEFPGRLIDATDLEKLGPADFEFLETHIIQADSDLNRFSPLTIDFINMLGKSLFNNDSLPQGLQAYDGWAKENITTESTQVIFNDLLDGRNEVVLSWLDRTLPIYDTIIIPWGAMHMPGLERAILERGFKQTSSREYLSVDFANLPIDQLLEKLSESSSPPTDEKLL